MNFIRFTLILIVVLLVPYAAASQTDDKPICLSQAAANVCRDNALLIPTLNEKIAALEAKVKAQEVTIAELKELNAKNVADLTAALHKTELQLAEKTGEIIACQANDVSNRAIITAMIPMLRRKTVGVTIF